MVSQPDSSHTKGPQLSITLFKTHGLLEKKILKKPKHKMIRFLYMDREDVA